MIFRALLWLVRFLVVLFVIRLVLRMIFPPSASSNPAGKRRPPAGQVPERSGGTLVRDPQCGTYITQSSAHRLQAAGETLYFCSTTCRDAWIAARPASDAKRA